MHFQKILKSSSIFVVKNTRISQQLHMSTYVIVNNLEESIAPLDTCRVPIPGIYFLEHNAEK